MNVHDKLINTLEKYDMSTLFDYLKLCVDQTIQENAITYSLLSLLVESLNIRDGKLLLDDCYNTLFSSESYHEEKDQVTGIPVKIYNIFEDYDLKLDKLLKTAATSMNNDEVVVFVNNFINQFKSTKQIEGAKFKNVQMSGGLGAGIIDTKNKQEERMKQMTIWQNIDTQETTDRNLINEVTTETNEAIEKIINYSPGSAAILRSNQNDITGMFLENRQLFNKFKKDKKFIYLLLISIFCNLHISFIANIYFQIYRDTIITKKLYDKKTRYPSRDYLIKTMNSIFNNVKQGSVVKQIKNNWVNHYLKYSIDGKLYLELMRKKGITETAIDELNKKLLESSYTIDDLYKMKALYANITGLKKNDLDKYFVYIDNPKQDVSNLITAQKTQVTQDELENLYDDLL